MSGTLSKRQQARNERALQDLIKSIPGNSLCADCSARNPGWASWNLGIFLCMRCAAIHRKLGTHITKVKSLSMDSWSNDQVENMKRVGNVISNRMYNPNNAKPPIPIDADEADSAMERFIRGKYAERAAKRHDTGSTNSDDHPPLPPPKTGSKFGLRSASSIFPLSSSKTRRERPPPVDILPTRRRSPSPDFAPSSRSKNIDTGPMDLAGKMNRLKDMGFTDNKRNLAVLNGLGGNLEKTIDTLVRLGEGTGNRAGSSRGSRTPVTPAFPNSPLGKVEKKPSPPNSSNPFDLLDVPPSAVPQSSQSTGSKPNLQSPANTNPFLSPVTNTNPFGLSPSHSQYNLNAAFQNLDVSNQQTQPLFPNHTGGFNLSQPQNQPMYQQSQPLPNVPQQFFPSNNVYTTQPQQPQNTSYNPFLQQSIQPVQHQPAHSVTSPFQNNPYTQQQLFASPAQTPQNQFPASIFDQQPQQVQGQSQPYNPFFPQTQQISQVQQVQQQAYGFQAQQSIYPQHAQTYPMPTQQPVKANNQSIMDLFNYPQLAPAKPQAENQYPQEQAQAPNSNYAVSSPQTQQQQFLAQNQPVAPASGSKNPFGNFQGASQNGDLLGNMPSFQPAPQQNGTRHVSQESISIGGGWENGRHSPDAWGTISGRGYR